MEQTPKKRPKIRLSRIFSLDLLRGIAAFMMIQGHFVYNTVQIRPLYYITDLYFFMSENFVYSLGWSLFFVIIGIGLAISIERQKLKQVPFKERLIHVLKRSGIFILIQYVYNILAWGILPYHNIWYYINPISSFALSNLIFEIGIWSLVVFFLMELPLKYRILIAGVIAFIGYYIIFMRGNVLFYILVGGIFGSYLLRELLKGKQDKIYKFFLVMGTVMLGVGLPLHIFTDIAERESSLIKTNYADYLGSPGFILYSLGMIWLMFAGFYWWLDIKKRNPKMFRPFILIGNLTLTIYVVHYIVLNQMQYNLGFYNYFTLVCCWAWNFALVIFVYIGAVFWSRYRYKYSLEWVIQTFT